MYASVALEVMAAVMFEMAVRGNTGTVRVGGGGDASACSHREVSGHLRVCRSSANLSQYSVQENKPPQTNLQTAMIATCFMKGHDMEKRSKRMDEGSSSSTSRKETVELVLKHLKHHDM